jgi:hypothetical protein
MKSTKIIVLVFLAALGGLLITACTAGLVPQMSYQGVLTDENGQPINGTVQFTYRLFNTGSGGSELYSQTENVAVANGLFNSVVGPSTIVAGLTPEDLTEPLYLEIQVANGVFTETLTPRQRLYGSPYAFTLMPGALISSTMPGDIFSASGINGVLSVNNSYDGDPTSDPALPALRVVGETGIELTSPTDDNGTLFSDQSGTSSDLFIYSNDNMQFYVDRDANEQGVFAFIGTPGSCQIVAGNLSCSGTKSASVQIAEEDRLLYAVESPEVWFEDFGSGTLADGQTTVTFEPLFAQSVNPSVDYYVFLTPLGDCNGLYVAEKTPTGFTVRELNGGTADIAFDYRIVAKRTGYEDVRMELANIDVEEE